jgi:hypothetical protein
MHIKKANYYSYKNGLTNSTKIPESAPESFAANYFSVSLNRLGNTRSPNLFILLFFLLKMAILYPEKKTSV